MEKMTTVDRFKVYILNADPNYGTEKCQRIKMTMEKVTM